jgi:Putative binding domain, N-terminal
MVPQNVTLVISANSGAARTATLTIAGTTVTVNQSSNSNCSYALSTTGQSFPAAGGNGSVVLTAATGCSWTASSNVTWITVTGTSTGTGNGTITYQVTANTGAARTGTLTIAGLAYTVQQVSASGSGGAVTGTLAQLAADGSWRTQFTLLNTGTVAASGKLSFFDNNGNPLNLNLSFPATPTQGTVTGPAIEQVINPGAELIINTSGPDNQPVVVGWAQLSTSGSITGFATFQQTIGSTIQEAVVPLETRNPTSFLVSFDNTGNGATGIALANVSLAGASIPVTIRDDQGNILLSAITSLAAQGHTSFDLASTYSVAANKRGTVEFVTPAAGQITVLGIHFNVTGAFSTIPPAVK